MFQPSNGQQRRASAQTLPLPAASGQLGRRNHALRGAVGLPAFRTGDRLVDEVEPEAQTRLRTVAEATCAQRDGVLIDVGALNTEMRGDDLRTHPARRLEPSCLKP